MRLGRNMAKKTPEVCALTNALNSGQTEAFLWLLRKLACKYRTDLNTVLSLCQNNLQKESC